MLPNSIGLHIVIKEYLIKLRRLERSKPESERLSVPTLKELSSLVGLSEKHFSRIINNKTRDIPRQTIAAVIHELRRRGFDTQVTDVVRYVE